MTANYVVTQYHGTFWDRLFIFIKPNIFMTDSEIKNALLLNIGILVAIVLVFIFLISLIIILKRKGRLSPKEL